VSVHTAASFLIISAGILLSMPDRGFVRLMRGRDAGGVLLRRLLRPAIVAPLALGWIRLEGQRAGLYGTEFGLALMVVVVVVVLFAFIWATAHSLSELDRSREFAHEAMREGEDRLRLAQEAARVGTYDWNIQTGVNRWTPEL